MHFLCKIYISKILSTKKLDLGISVNLNIDFYFFFQQNYNILCPEDTRGLRNLCLEIVATTCMHISWSLITREPMRWALNLVIHMWSTFIGLLRYLCPWKIVSIVSRSSVAYAWGTGRDWYFILSNNFFCFTESVSSVDEGCQNHRATSSDPPDTWRGWRVKMPEIGWMD